MKLPAIIYIIISAINLLAAANLHGQPRSNYNFWTLLLGTAIGTGLLFWGGFFAP